MIERYSRKEIKNIWEDYNKYSIWLDIELTAAELGLEKLTANASHQARVHFERQGWTVETAQTIERKGVFIENFAMGKSLQT